MTELPPTFTAWLRSCTPSDVLRLWVEGRANRASIPSLLGRFGAGPPSTSGPTGEWEIVLGLVKGVNAESADVWDYMTLGVSGHSLRLDEEIDLPDREPIQLFSQRAEPPTMAQVAKRMGVGVAYARVLRQAAVDVVGDNLAAFRARDRAARLAELRGA